MQSRFAMLAVCICSSFFAELALAAEEPAEGAAVESADASFPADEDSYNGDLLKLRVTVGTFREVGANGKVYCAPKGSVLTVSDEDQGVLSVRFKKVPKEDNMPTHLLEENPTGEALNACSAASRVNDFTQYEIDRATLLKYDFRRTGVTFGALVVPFKFYLSGERKITASSTIAPYLGFRGPSTFGLTLTPVISAGLGLVPVTDPNSGETETKSALSTAIGLVLTSTKNDAFNAGVVIGRDFLSRSDEASDPNVDEPWFSLYVGYKL
jgi:hypothetical protein